MEMETLYVIVYYYIFLLAFRYYLVYTMCKQILVPPQRDTALVEIRNSYNVGHRNAQYCEHFVSSAQMRAPGYYKQIKQSLQRESVYLSIRHQRNEL